MGLLGEKSKRQKAEWMPYGGQNQLLKLRWPGIRWRGELEVEEKGCKSGSMGGGLKVIKMRATGDGA